MFILLACNEQMASTLSRGLDMHMLKDVEIVENITLIENSLVHLDFELHRGQPSFFRVAREAHLILYRAMIEALRGTANLDILRPDGKMGNSYRFSFQEGIWMEVVREKVTGCRKAWRFSDPRPCDPPREDSGEPPNEEDAKDTAREVFQKLFSSDLIPFYSALAKIQAEPFMHRFTCSLWEKIPDEDVRLLEWVHEEVRNKSEHFVPMLYGVPVATLVSAAELCVRITETLLFRSNNVVFSEPDQYEGIQSMLEKSRSHLQNLMSANSDTRINSIREDGVST